MAETTTDLVFSDAALFRAVHTIPFTQFRDIICTHYGTQQVQAELRKIPSVRRHKASGNANLDLYIRITHRLGKRDSLVGDVMRVYRDFTDSKHVSKGTLDPVISQDTQPLVETVPAQDIQSPVKIEDPSVSDGGMTKAAESVMVLEDAEDSSEYLEAFKCNTTLSCYFDIGDIECSAVDDDSEDASDYEDSDSDRGDADADADVDDHCLMSTLVQGDTSDQTSGDRLKSTLVENNVLDQDDRGDCLMSMPVQGDSGQYHGILEDETVAKPKVVIEED